MVTTYSPGTAVGAIRRSWAFPLLALLLLLNVLVGTGLWYVSGALGTRAVLRDLDSRFAALQSLPDAAALMNPATSRAFQAQLAGIQADVQKLNNTAQFVGGARASTAVQHALRLTSDLCVVGQDAARLVNALGPGVRLLLRSMVTTPTASGGALPPAFSASELADANSILSQVRIDWSRAFHDRQRLTADDLQVLPVPALVKLVEAYDSVEPQVGILVTISSAALADVSTLLGLTRPANYLLLNTDTNDLRAAGGFISSFALLTMSGGRLQSSITLKSVHGLDCPNNVCPVRHVPAGYSWFKPATDAQGNSHFGLQDANLDPNLPDSAQLLEAQFQRETGTSVDGVILITPAVLAQLLSVTGPVMLPGFHDKISADTVQDQLGRSHQSGAASQHNASALSAIDAQLAQAVLPKLSAINSRQLDAIAAHLAADLYTKDLQVYFNDPVIEGVLQTAHLAGEVRAAPDSLMVVDTSDAGTFSYAPVTETQDAAVQLDAQGGAQHSLSIRYDYASAASAGQLATALADFGDLVRVIVPQTASGFHITGPCAPTSAAEVGFSVLACRIMLKPGQSALLHFSWYVPHAGTQSKSPFGYALLVQRQAGSESLLTIQIAPPNGHTFSSGNATPYVRVSSTPRDFTIRTTVK